MKLKNKILIGYGGALILMGLVFSWAILNLVSLGKATDAILRENYRSIIAAEKMINALERQDSGILIMFMGDSETGIAQFRENEAVFFEWLTRARDNITIQGEIELVQDIDDNYAKLRLEFSSLTERAVEETLSKEHSLKKYQELYLPIFTNIRESCAKLRYLNENTMYSASVMAGKVAKRAIWSTVLIAASALIIALIFSLLLADRIVRPLRDFMEASRKISSGDYSIQVQVKTRDELGHLAREFNQMAAQIKQYHEINIDQIISEKNKGEAILSSIDDGLVVFDTDLKVTGINPAARRILDLKIYETSSLSCLEILPMKHLCRLIQTFVATGGQTELTDDERVITLPSEGDSLRHYLFSIIAIRGRDRNLSGVVLLLKDVTRLKEVEKLKSEFIMAASHELRTPLTSIGMSIDLLMEHADFVLTKNDKELLQAAHEEVNRMKVLTNELLDLSRIEAEKIELDMDNVPILTLFEHIMPVFRSQLEMKDVSLTSELADNVSKVRADSNKIIWVLTNLISNALRYVDKGGHIIIFAKKIGDYVHISVQDDGPGIPVQYQTKIFQKFFQVKGTVSGGAGLGLAICREIVRAHGGTIWVESTVGKGSLFTFTLPAA